MRCEIRSSLNGWKNDEKVSQVIIDAGEKAFCAGGDIAKLYHKGRLATLQMSGLLA